MQYAMQLNQDIKKRKTGPYLLTRKDDMRVYCMYVRNKNKQNTSKRLARLIVFFFFVFLGGYDVVDLEPGRAGRRISRDPVLPHLTKVHLFITTHKRTIIMSIKKKNNPSSRQWSVLRSGLPYHVGSARRVIKVLDFVFGNTSESELVRSTNRRRYLLR